jgi:hypothetical protein
MTGCFCALSIFNSDKLLAGTDKQVTTRPLLNWGPSAPPCAQSCIPLFCPLRGVRKGPSIACCPLPMPRGAKHQRENDRQKRRGSLVWQGEIGSRLARVPRHDLGSSLWTDARLSKVNWDLAIWGVFHRVFGCSLQHMMLGMSSRTCWGC